MQYIAYVLCLAIGFLIGVLVYRNNAGLFEKLLAPHLKKYEETQAQILAKLSVLESKLLK